MSAIRLSFFKAMALLLAATTVIDVFGAECHVFLPFIFINYFMIHMSCDYVVRLKHTEHSNGEVVIHDQTQNYDFFHTSIRNSHDVHPMSKLPNRCIDYLFLHKLC